MLGLNIHFFCEKICIVEENKFFAGDFVVWEKMRRLLVGISGITNSKKLKSGVFAGEKFTSI